LLDAAELEVMRQALTAIPEEMGVVLVRSSYSPNIKERKDASCALFDPLGRMVAQAEHIPVHLGSMPMAVENLLATGDEIGPGDSWIVNNPYTGGSHLNDVTVISAVHDVDDRLLGFVVNKAHHADVGGSAPGSMPAAATSLQEEGVVLDLQPLTRARQWVGDARDRLIGASRTPEERRADLGAQLSANIVGGRRLVEHVDRYGLARWGAFCDQIIDYSRRRMVAALGDIKPGTYRAEGYIEAPTVTEELEGLEVPDMGDVRIAVEVVVSPDRVVFDLSGTDRQVNAPWNAPYSVTLSAVYFTLRAMTDPSIPPNHGCYLPVEVVCPRGSLLNPEPPHPVGAGNVETSQILAGVLLSALGQATRDGPVAMSQGTMNNVLIGATGERPFTFYETIGGGEGGSPWREGMSGVHTHMTNTANTPVESLEVEYPLKVQRLTLVRGSGGQGHHSGGDGVHKELVVLADGAVLTILSDGRRIPPKGQLGGDEGRVGLNLLERNGEEHPLPSKLTLPLTFGDVVHIETPSGGGWERAGSQTYSNDEGPLMKR
jgi:N-methylhydantoinase B